MAAPVFSADTAYQRLPKDEQRAIDEAFTSALYNRAALDGIRHVTKPAIQMPLDEADRARLIELEQNQALYLKGDAAILKFVSTEEGIVLMETSAPDTLKITGGGIGRTFVHVWDEKTRHTFEIRVTASRIPPSAAQLRQQEELQKSRSFVFGYDGSHNSFYRGDKFREQERTDVDFTQSFRFGGDTPYGTVRSLAKTQHEPGREVLTQAYVALDDGRVGSFENFNAIAGDAPVVPGLMVFPSGVVRGAEVEHWDKERLRWTAFHGREQASILGTVSPTIGERTRDSFLSGAFADYKMNEDARLRGGLFTAYGQSRPDELNNLGAGLRGDFELGPRTLYVPEIGYDNESVAQRHAFTVSSPTFSTRAEYRNINKEFVSMLGSSAGRGELGYRFELNATPFENMDFSGTLDTFRDRLIPNPEQPDDYNFHADALLDYRFNSDTSVLFNRQILDDTGRLGPRRQERWGAQLNRRFEVFGHRVSTYGRYQNVDTESLKTPTANYIQDQFMVGFSTPIFWGINFSLQKEWNFVDEINLGSHVRPHALVLNFDMNRRLWDWPVYFESRLRFRDEENTESTNSFMAGEDSTEVTGGLYYRGFENMELYLIGSFENFRPESLNVTNPRTETQVTTGVRYLFDTHARWSPSGSFEGFVFKDLNGDGTRQPDEPGIEGIGVESSDGKKAVSDAAGHYVLKSISGRTAVLTLNTSDLPFGHIPTLGARREAPILHHKTQQVDFGLAARSEITGLVFNDLDADGRFDAATDSGVGKVKLLLEDGRAARSNSRGEYLFSNVPAGDHVITMDLMTLPEGYLPLVSTQKEFTLFEGMRYELSFPVRARRAVAGRVFLDANANGRMDAGELPAIDARVTLGSESGKTDDSGYYLLDDVPQGTFRLGVDVSTLREGWALRSSVVVEIPQEPITVSDMNLALTRSELREDSN